MPAVRVVARVALALSVAFPLGAESGQGPVKLSEGVWIAVVGDWYDSGYGHERAAAANVLRFYPDGRFSLVSCTIVKQIGKAIWVSEGDHPSEFSGYWHRGPETIAANYVLPEGGVRDGRYREPFEEVFESAWTWEGQGLSGFTGEFRRNAVLDETARTKVLSWMNALWTNHEAQIARRLGRAATSPPRPSGR